MSQREDFFFRDLAQGYEYPGHEVWSYSHTQDRASSERGGLLIRL
jgi:hypothetical protein